MSQYKKIKNEDAFNILIEEAEQEPFVGWDFSYITQTQRESTEPLKWSYASRVIPIMRQTKSMLDMGTGGGEFLSRLQPFPEETSATETHEQNAQIARNKLQPFGIEVYQVEPDKQLPFQDGKFNLVINRHEFFNAVEVMRILKNNGLFITQQVGGINDMELNKYLGMNIPRKQKDWTLNNAVKQIKDAGFEVIEHLEDFPICRFYDVGAVVYHLKAVPWQFPDFSIKKHRDNLADIHNDIQSKGYIEVTNHRFLITARKKG